MLETRGLRQVQRLLDATSWLMLGGGCHAGRDTVAAIENARFTVERLDRLRFPESRILLPTSPHVLGIAINPGRAEVAHLVAAELNQKFPPGMGRRSFARCQRAAFAAAGSLLAIRRDVK